MGTKLNRFIKNLSLTVLLEIYRVYSYMFAYFLEIKNFLSGYINFWSIIKLVVFLMGFVVTRTLYLMHTSTYSEGANWVVVQLSSQGVPIKCFSVQDRLISYTPTGLAWQGYYDEQISISMPYRAARVDNERWEAAYTSVGLSAKVCAMLESAVIDIEPYNHPSQGSSSSADIETFGKKLDNSF